MSYSQNLGSLMDDIGADQGVGGKKAKGGNRSGGSGGSTPFWKSQGAVGALAVLAVVVLVLGVWFSFFSGGAPKPPSSLMLIDVSTGEMFSVKLGKRSHVIPAKNPDTGVRSIFPVEESDDGGWKINERYLFALDDVKYNSSVIVDINNGTVVPTDDDPKRLH